VLDPNDPIQARILERLRTAEYAYLTTIRPDGRPHTVPICYLWEDGAILICSLAHGVKINNLRQNPLVSLSLDHFGEPAYFSVVIEGTAELVGEGGIELTYPPYAAKYTPLSRRMFGTDIPPADFIQQFSQTIRVTPTRIRHDD
jgi:PPOX class probable F420-dependent enzyme